MPNRNGTGPEGKGSRTGRGLGSCNSTGSTQSGDVFRGAGRGRGLGRGLGFRRNVNNVTEENN